MNLVKVLTVHLQMYVPDSLNKNAHVYSTSSSCPLLSPRQDSNANDTLFKCLTPVFAFCFPLKIHESNLH